MTCRTEEWLWAGKRKGRAGMFEELLRDLGIERPTAAFRAATVRKRAGGRGHPFEKPGDRRSLPAVRTAASADYDRVVARAQQAFQRWRMVPPPQRGEVVRQLGAAFVRESRNWAFWSRSRPARSGAKGKVKFRK